MPDHDVALDSGSALTTGPVVIAGGSGFLGMNLAQHLAGQGRRVIVMSRSRPRDLGSAEWVQWDGREPGAWCAALDGAGALVNLAGRTVDCIKTPDHCDEILRSRVESTLVLGHALRAATSPPPVWVQMSTAHRYGDSPSITCHEDSPFGVGLAPFVGEAWEQAHADALLPGMRSVVMRTSFVLGRNGGALPRLAGLTRFGLGGRVGSGKQGISWIHEDDMNRLFARAISDESMSGAYLATAPNPVSHAEFMRALRRGLRMPIGLPAFEWMVRIGAPLIMRTDPELALYGRYCVSRRLTEEGFEFTYPDIDPAMQAIYGRS